MEYKDLTPELLEEAKACKSPEEFLGFCKKNMITLSDEQLEALSGGAGECNIGYICRGYQGCGFYFITPGEA